MASGGQRTLIIKAPNQKYEDQTIHCPFYWTVGRLKSHIALVYPSRPPCEEQRLVYLGRLLQDHLQLEDVLRKQDDCHIMHLICNPKSPPAFPETQHDPAVLLESTATPTQDSQPVSSSSPLIRGGSDGLRSRPSFPSTAGAPQWPDGSQVVLQGTGPRPLYPTLQVLWWQQMYARHYYMQYQAAVAASQPPGTSYFTSSSSSSSLPRPAAPPNEAVPPPPPLAARREPEPLPENRAANANLQMNAQGGAVLNDDELNHDWLDWLYTVVRAGVLLGIIYFYSTFSRLVMVVGALLLLYLHQARWFPFGAEQQQQQQQQEAAIGAPPLEEQQEMVSSRGSSVASRQRWRDPLLSSAPFKERLMDDGMEEDESSEEGGPRMAEEQLEAPPELGFLSAAWTFVSTFFTSLIPEGRPHPAN